MVTLDVFATDRGQEYISVLRRTGAQDAFQHNVGKAQKQTVTVQHADLHELLRVSIIPLSQ